jgi:hypothetical protein
VFSLIVLEKELQFEHSLVSLSDWEAEYEKPFFSAELTNDEMLRYFECMLVRPQKQRHLVRLLTPEQLQSLSLYIGKSRTATTVREIQNRTGKSENVTSELIYYWLVMFKIPFKPTDEWHLNRLLMLVKVCGHKQAPAKKQSRESQAQRIQSMRELNEQRKKERGTSG